jgi:gluconolactonase
MWSAPAFRTGSGPIRMAGDGVHCIAPDGTLLGKILVPEIVSNVCFGGRAKHHLYITATTSLYMVALNRKGVQQP